MVDTDGSAVVTSVTVSGGAVCTTVAVEVDGGGKSTTVCTSILVIVLGKSVSVITLISVVDGVTVIVTNSSVVVVVSMEVVGVAENSSTTSEPVKLLKGPKSVCVRVVDGTAKVLALTASRKNRTAQLTEIRAIRRRRRRLLRPSERRRKRKQRQRCNGVRSHSRLPSE